MVEAAVKKKEKPLVKTPIPGTEWLRVKTTEGNIFYTHKGRKESVWIVPDEIREVVEALERSEEHAMEQAQLQQSDADGASTNLAQQEEKVDVKITEAEAGLGFKRKAEEPAPLEEVVVTKKIRKEDEDEEEETEGEDSSEEEEWQREAAAQLAAEAEEERARQEEEARAMEEKEAETKKSTDKMQFNVPDRVQLSLEEAKALFKVSIQLVQLHAQIYQWCRLYSEKKISILSTPGIPRYIFSCLTHDMYFSLPYLHVVTPLTSIAETVPVSSANKMSRRKRPMQTLERSLIACSLKRSRVLELLGPTSDELGKRISVSTVGAGTIGNARNALRSFLENWEKVCAF